MVRPWPESLTRSDGLEISESTGALLVNSLAMRHGLTQAAVSDVLEVLRLHLPATQSQPSLYKSVHRLTSSMQLQSHISHSFCKDCREVVNTECDGECMHTEIITFYEMPIDEQLQAMFSKCMHVHLIFSL